MGSAQNVALAQKEPSGIEVAIKRLHVQLNELESIEDALAGRLSFIRANRPEPMPETAGGVLNPARLTPVQSTCLLEDEINSAVARIDSMIEHMRRVNSELRL